MEIKGNQNIFDFTLEKFGTLENLFDDVLVPNSLPIDRETQSNQEVNINAVGKGDDDVKMKISEQGLSMTNGDIPIIVESIFDADAQAYLEAIAVPNNETIYYESTPQEITGAEIWTAVIDFFIGAKSDGWYTKKKAIYTIIGGTLATHKYNAKDSRDLAAAFRLSWNGGVALSGAHTATGVKPNGTDAYADTFLNPLSHLPTNSMSLSYYSRENINTGTDQIDMGCSIAVYLWLSAKYEAGGFVDRFLARNSSVSILANTENLDARGLYDCSKTSNGTDTFKTHKNGVVQDTQDGAGDNPNRNVYLFADNESGQDAFWTNRECAYASIGEGMTDTDSANEYIRVQALQAALHREV